MAAKTRPRKITFRLSDEELELFNQKLEASGKTQQEYCRLAVLEKEVRNIEGLKEFGPELKRIGNNFNQIAKAYNATGHIEEWEKMSQWIGALNRMYSMLQKLIKG